MSGRELAAEALARAAWRLDRVGHGCWRLGSWASDRFEGAAARAADLSMKLGEGRS